MAIVVWAIATIWNKTPGNDDPFDDFQRMVDRQSGFRKKYLTYSGISDEQAKGCEVHHIVPFSPRAEDAQKALARPEDDISLNSMRNAVLLEKGPHQALHNQEYYDTINEDIGLSSPGGAGVALDKVGIWIVESYGCHY